MERKPPGWLHLFMNRKVIMACKTTAHRVSQPKSVTPTTRPQDISCLLINRRDSL